MEMSEEPTYTTMKRKKTGLGAKFAVVMAALLLGAASANAAPATITWGDGTSLPSQTYGTRLLAGNVLNASSGGGTFTYAVIISGQADSQAVNLLLNAGENYLVRASYTPTTAEATAGITAATADRRLTVSKVALTLVPKSKTRTYGTASTFGVGEATWAADINVAGSFVNGETVGMVGVITTHPTLAEKPGITAFTAPSSIADGIIFTVAPVAANYSFNTASAGGLTISGGSLVLKADGATKVYGSADPVFTGSYSLNGGAFIVVASGTTVELVGAGTASADKLTIEWRSGIVPTVPPAPEKNPVQINSVTAKAIETLGTPSLSKYAVSIQNAVFNVTKKTLTVTSVATPNTKVYGEANPPFTLGYAGFVNGDTASVFTTAPTLGAVAVTVDAGARSIPIVAGSAANYAITAVEGVLTVTARPVIVKFNGKSRVFGTPNPTVFDYAVEPHVPTATTSPTPFLGGAGPRGLAPHHGNASSNVVLNQGTADLLGSTTALIGSPVGSYPITRLSVAGVPTGTFSANYDVTVTDGTLDVTKLLPTLTWTISGADSRFEYGATLGARLGAGATPLTLAGAVPSKVTYTAHREGETPFVVDTTRILRAGFYTLTAIYEPGTTDSATHAIGRFQISGIEVTKRVIKLKVNDQARAYNATDAGLLLGRGGLSVTLVSGTLAPGTVDTVANIFYTTSGATFVADVTKGDPTITPSAVQTSNAGTYALVASGGNTPDYVVTYAPGVLTVNKLSTSAPTWTIAAGKETVDYGTPLNSDQFSAQPVGGGPAGSVQYKVGATAINGATILLAGTTSLEAYFVPSDAVNYNSSTTTVKVITVKQKRATIKAPTGKSRVYGAAGPTDWKYVAPADFAVNDLLPNDRITVEYFIATEGRDTAGPVRAPVGTYALNAQITDPDNKLSNYVLTLESGTFNITKKVVTITVKADRKKVFGELYVPLTAAADLDYAGFIDAETYTTVVGNSIGVVDGGVTTTAAVVNILNADGTVLVPSATTAYGSYRISVAAALSRNYTYTPNGGFFNVTKIQPVLDITEADLNALLGVGGLFYGERIQDAKLGGAPTAYLSSRTARTTAGGAFLDSVAATVVSGAHMVVPFNDNKGRLYITFMTGYNSAKGLYNSATGATKNTLLVQFFPSDPNYADSSTTFSFNVDKRDVTVTVASDTRSYGNGNPIYKVSYASGEPDISAGVKAATWVGTDKDVDVDSDANGDKTNENEPAAGILTVQPIAASTTATLIAAAGSSGGGSVGAHAITFPQGAIAANYRFAEVTGGLTITRRPLTVTTKLAERTYLAANPVIEIDYNNTTLGGLGFPSFENENTAKNADLSFFQKGQFNTADLPQPATASAATYPVIVSGSFGSNYLITHVPGTLIVNKALATLGWPSPANITYGTAIGAAQATATATFGGASVAGSFVYTEAGQILGAGARTLKATFTSLNLNVAGGEVATTLAVNKAPITATAVSATSVYGESNPVFAINYSPFTGPDATIDSPPTVITTRTAGSPVGSYDLVVTGGVDENYQIVPVNTGKLIVTAKALTITGKSVSRAYGTSNPSLETIIDGLISGDSATSLSTIVTTTSAAASSPVGEYAIAVSGGTSANYTTTTVAGKLTVSKAPLTISVKSASKQYNADNPTAELEYVGFLGTDTAASLKTPAVATHAAAKASDVGTYDITVVGATSDNYDIAFTKGTLTVTKADPKIVWAAPADIDFGALLSATQLNASSTTAGSFTYAPALGEKLVAGSAQVLAVTLTPTDAKNYNSATANALINVNKAAPVITWAVPSAITYGTSLGSAQLNATSSAVGTITYAPAIGTVLGAGSRSLSATFVPTDAANYSQATAGNTILVDKAALIISADSKSKQFNADLPELTQSVSGLASGDTMAIVGTIKLLTSATKTSPIGSYQIGLSGTLSAANYSIQFVPGVLTVTKAVPAIVWAALADITVGTALGDTQLNPSSTIAGIFAYVPAKGTVLPLGNGQKLEAIFIPSDAINYELVRAGNTLNVTTPAVKAKNPSDLNGDGLSDALFQHTDGFLAAWFLDGANLKAATLLTPETAGDAKWEVVGFSDFNGDGSGDLLFQYNGGNFDGALAIWYMNGTTLTEAKLTTPANPGDGWTAVAVGDFNGDKKADILFQHDEGFLALWYMNGALQASATLLNPVAPFGVDGTVDAGWRAVAATDLNGDQKLDIVFQYRGGSFNGTVAVWYMNGINQTGAALLEPSNPGAGWSIVGSGDYNNDGKSDLLLQHSSGLTGVWYLNGVRLNSAVLLNPESPGAGWRVVGP